jgi:hypothetical protein
MTRFKQDKTARNDLAHTAKLADMNLRISTRCFMSADMTQCGISLKALIPSL